MVRFNVERTPSLGPFCRSDLSVMVEAKGNHEKAVRQTLNFYQHKRPPCYRTSFEWFYSAIEASFVVFEDDRD